MASSIALTTAAALPVNETPNLSKVKPSIHIAQYNEKEKDEVVRLFEAGMDDAWDPNTDETSQRLIAEYKKQTTPEFDNVSEMICSARGGRLFIAHCKNEIVGMIGVKLSEEDIATQSVQLIRMSVKKSFRRHGVGSKLISHAVDYARNQLGAVRVWLTTLETMTAAVRFYAAYGFVRDADFHLSLAKPGAADVVKYELPVC